MRLPSAAFVLAILVALPAYAQTPSAPASKPRSSRGKLSTMDAPANPVSGFFVEPRAGYSLGTLEFGSKSAPAGGPAFGARAGYVTHWFFAGVQGGYAVLGDGNDLQAGLVAGATLPSIPLRFSLAFAIVDSMASTIAARTLQADTVTLGASYFLKDWLAVNFDYDIRTYAKINQAGTLITPKFNSLVFSLSLPIGVGIESLPKVSADAASRAESESHGSGGVWD